MDQSLTSLRRLEYRGYNSSGIVLDSLSHPLIFRQVGKIDALTSSVYSEHWCPWDVKGSDHHKPLYYIIYEDLMDNHQCELAEELADMKHLFYACPQTLHETIKGMDLQSLLPFPPGDAMPVAKLMIKFLGFPCE